MCSLETGLLATLLWEAQASYGNPNWSWVSERFWEEENKIGGDGQENV